jgi:23S rRNA (pseudouridine1915-N3)-methyltransferase
MQIRVLAVGQRMPDWMKTGVDDYMRRLPKGFNVEWLEIQASKRVNGSSSQYRRKDSGNIQSRLKKGDLVVALEASGTLLSTESFAEHLGSWQMQARRINILIGGPDGLDSDLLELADARWSFGALTLPHTLVRVVLAEQLYRAWAVMTGHPYHRGA